MITYIYEPKREERYLYQASRYECALENYFLYFSLIDVLEINYFFKLIKSPCLDLCCMYRISSEDVYGSLSEWTMARNLLINSIKIYMRTCVTRKCRFHKLHWKLVWKLCDFQGFGPILLRNPLFLWFFRTGGVVGDPGPLTPLWIRAGILCVC